MTQENEVCILNEVKEIRKELADFKEKSYENHLQTQIKITRLEGKSKLWGAVGGAITNITVGIFGLIIWLIKTK